ncbi:MAG TPA: 4-hydroxy-tetrahydrodipicolinate reductase [Pirellulales bacterium]
MNMAAIRIAIHGAAGRMGQRLVALASADPELKIVAALEAAGHPRLGEDAGTIAGVGPLALPVAAASDELADVVIDFSTPAGAMEMLATCFPRRIPVVIATTGFSAAQSEKIRSAARELAVLWAPSMSLAVNLAMRLTDVAADALKHHPSGADVEIIERHHRFKEDAPSGTALKFGEIVAARMGQTHSRHGREGRPGSRPHGEIGYHAVRTGDNPGEHTIIFGLLGETLEVTVRASNRDCYAHGALAAAKFLARQQPGLYTMNDVLFGPAE